MPSVSKAQRNLMAAAAHNPSFAKKVGVPVKVAKEFNKADTGKKFARGGEMKTMFRGKETPAEEKKEAKALKSGKISKAQYVAGEKSEGHGAGAAKKAAAIKSGKLSPAAYAKEHAMKKGGMTAGKAAHAVKEGKRVAKEMEYDYKTGKKSFAGSTAKKDAHAEKEGRKVAKDLEFDYSKGRKMARGGGVEVRGKTKGTMVKMCGGGKAKGK